MDNEERQKEVARLIARLNGAYRDLFKLKGISKQKLESARKVVLEDLDAILRARTWFPDKDGRYDPYRAAKEEGNRMCARDLIDKINSNPRSGEKGENKPKVVRT